MTTILCVDDEETFRETLSFSLQEDGYDVIVASDGKEALHQFQQHHVDLIVLDVMMPHMSGTEVCRTIRATSTVPIIMLTAKDDVVDCVVALEIGADDYVTKPMTYRELLARIRAVLRRKEYADNDSKNYILRDNSTDPTVKASFSHYLSNADNNIQRNLSISEKNSGDKNNEDIVTVGHIELDHKRHIVRKNGVIINLPLREFELLEYLMMHPGIVVTRCALMEHIWRDSYYADSKTLDVHIKRLRSRIEDNPAQPTLIITVRGLGYKIIAHES